MLTATLMAAGLASVLAVTTPAHADDEVIEHRAEESTHVRTGGAPAVRERVIEREAAPAAVEHRSKETVVKKGDHDDDNDVDVNVDVDKD
jgi:hypothetical protein